MNMLKRSTHLIVTEVGVLVNLSSVQFIVETSTQISYYCIPTEDELVDIKMRGISCGSLARQRLLP